MHLCLCDFSLMEGTGELCRQDTVTEVSQVWHINHWRIRVLKTQQGHGDQRWKTNWSTEYTDHKYSRQINIIGARQFQFYSIYFSVFFYKLCNKRAFVSFLEIIKLQMSYTVECVNFFPMRATSQFIDKVYPSSSVSSRPIYSSLFWV